VQIGLLRHNLSDVSSFIYGKFGQFLSKSIKKITSFLLYSSSKPQFLDAAESLFICMHRENEKCVNKGLKPPIESPLFNLIKKREIDHQ
jgi:hypothetical protein